VALVLSPESDRWQLAVRNRNDHGVGYPPDGWPQFLVPFHINYVYSHPTYFYWGVNPDLTLFTFADYFIYPPVFERGGLLMPLAGFKASKTWECISSWHDDIDLNYATIDVFLESEVTISCDP
jgi:hypothetical protein